MRELKDISWNVDEATYREDPALSYSTLAKYERGGFEILPKLFDKVESPSLTFGSAVDAMITGGQEEFDRMFLPADMPVMTDAMLDLANKLFNQCCSVYSNIDDIPDIGIKNVADECNYGRTWKVSTVADKVREACGDFYRLKFIAGDRTLLPTAVYEKVLRTVDALKTSEATKFYFAEDNPFNDDIKRYYQLKFKSTYNNVDYRCMADEIIVNYAEKTIQPIDLKTSSHKEYDFYKSFIDWSYAIQARLYWRIIRDNLDRDSYFKDFKLLDYKFIVVNKESLMPMVWLFPFTQSVGELTLGKNKDIILRDPYTIGEELYDYLARDAKVPNGIVDNGVNNIVSWISAKM